MDEQAVGRLEGKLDLLIDMHKTLRENTEEDLSKHDERITSVEKKVNLATGGFIAITTLVSLFAYLTGALHTLFFGKG